MMGADKNQEKLAQKDEFPVHQVRLTDYYIAETEVTQKLWKAVMKKCPSREKGDNLPVVDVPYKDCMTFITKLSKLTGVLFRLPTEAEWEYAARGGHKSKGFIFSGSNEPLDVAWTKENSIGYIHEVGTKSPQ